MSLKPNQPFQPDGGTPDRTQSALIARRRLLRGGLGVAPVLLASAPRSVMATGGGGNCVPASSFASINASRPDLVHNCSGRKPDAWKQDWCQGQWPSPCVPTGLNATKFGAVCGSSDSVFAGKTMLQVLQSTDADATRGGFAGETSLRRRTECAQRSNRHQCARHDDHSKCMGRLCCSGLLHEPTAGIRWYVNGSSVPSGSGGIMQWLKSTMPG